MRNLGRVLLAAPRSGSGKTIITCGLLKYLKDAGFDVRSYKCGPDYIDPMFHRKVIGVPGGNLDTFFSGEDELRNIIASGCRGHMQEGSEEVDQSCRHADWCCECNADTDGRDDSLSKHAAVIEGVMGIYDGITGMSGKGSCYDVARSTGTPVVLIADVRGMGQTMLSVIKGILADDTEQLIRGVILNRISGGYYREIRPLMDDMLAVMSEGREHDVTLLGGIPSVKDIRLESRHLGLMMPGEIDDLQEQVDAARDLLAENVDMEALLGIMGQAGCDPADGDGYSGGSNYCYADDGDPVTIAAARDEAFCFYYEENLRMLERCGIKVAEFSPLHDDSLPEGACGILLGGGYPELYAEMLAGNECMRASIREAVKGGMPFLAECGGFMYLLDELITDDGIAHPMCGVFRGASKNTGRLGRFGYITVSGAGSESESTEPGMQPGNTDERLKSDPEPGGWDEAAAADTLISGLNIRGHEFHYYDSDNNGHDAAAIKPGSGRTWECMHTGENYLAGYPHLYYPSCPELVMRLKSRMQLYQESHREASQ